MLVCCGATAVDACNNNEDCHDVSTICWKQIQRCISCFTLCQPGRPTQKTCAAEPRCNRGNVRLLSIMRSFFTARRVASKRGIQCDTENCVIKRVRDISANKEINSIKHTKLYRFIQKQCSMCPCCWTTHYRLTDK